MVICCQKGGVSAMPSLSAASQPARLIKSVSPINSFQPDSARVLVVSPELETRQALRRTLEAFSADVVVCSNRVQAEDVLSRQLFDVIFCDSSLGDGSYAEVIHANHRSSGVARTVVTVREKDSEFNANAIAKGAFAVVRWPGFATDIELALLRAMRQQRQQNQLAYSAVA